MAEVVVIVNPKSAGGKTAKAWSRLRKYVPPEFQVWETHYRGHATELTSAALQTSARTIVAVGGDGTISEVVNGFFADEQLIAPEAALGIIPFGTSSDLRRTLDLPTDPKEALFVIQNASPRPIDLMRVRYTTSDGSTATRYCVNVMSLGMGGVVAARVNRFGYIVATAVSTMGYSGRSVTLRFDDGDAIEKRITNVAIGNGRYHGSGMMVCPDARVDDGLLDVTVIERMTLLEIAANMKMLYNGAILRHPKVQSHRSKRIRAESSETTLIEIDGESLGRLPVEIEVLPHTIKVLK